MTGAVPFAFVRSRLMTVFSKSKASISDVHNALNRPEVPEHSDAIAKYLVDNRGRSYILPPLTLNVQEPVRLYSVDYSNAQIRPGYLVVPATGKLAITDGQHRRSGIIKAFESLDQNSQDEMNRDAIGVMITCETDSDQIHQDFADCSKTKALSPSQLAVYDRRNPANKIVVDLGRLCPIFIGKVDATSQKLGKKSTLLFTANQVRQFVKSMLVGSWGMADLDFEKRAKERLGSDKQYNEWRDRMTEYLNTVVENCPVLNELAGLQMGVDANKIPLRRGEGWICLTASGLVIMGLIGHELSTRDDWRDYAARLGHLDWSRDADHWQGVLVNNKKIITSQSAVKNGVTLVRSLIGLDGNIERNDAAA